MIRIDGSIGEGGGQILRTALGLSMVTGQPFRIERIRAGRKKPGLLRQHLTAVNAAAAICNAAVNGAAMGSQVLAFTPGKVTPGEYRFSVGSAGSTTLVLQAVLPALLTAEGPSTLTLEGGTHNSHAPPLDFLEQAFIPLINRMGPTVSVALDRAGFHPAGGGRFTVNIQPSPMLLPLHLPKRGEIKRKLAKAMVAALPGSIARRELDRVGRTLDLRGDQLLECQLPDAWGPGNILTIEMESKDITEVFTGFGRKGVSAEAVADQAVRQARQYIAADVPVGSFLADQLLLPLALAGAGSFLTLPLTPHAVTNIDVVEQFLPVRIEITQASGDSCLVTISNRG